MKKLVVVLFLVSSVFGFNLHMKHIKQPAADKSAHFFVSAFLTSQLDNMYCDYYKNKFDYMPTKLQRFVFSVGTTVFIGALKETYDSQAGEHWDHNDLKADVLGSLVGYFFQISFRW